MRAPGAHVLKVAGALGPFAAAGLPAAPGTVPIPVLLARSRVSRGFPPLIPSAPAAAAALWLVAAAVARRMRMRHTCARSRL